MTTTSDAIERSPIAFSDKGRSFQGAQPRRSRKAIKLARASYLSLNYAGFPVVARATVPRASICPPRNRVNEYLKVRIQVGGSNGRICVVAN